MSDSDSVLIAGNGCGLFVDKPALINDLAAEWIDPEQIRLLRYFADSCRVGRVSALSDKVLCSRKMSLER